MRTRSLVIGAAVAAVLAVCGGQTGIANGAVPAIINGTPNTGWERAVVFITTDDGRACSGGLLQSNVVVTAAHCVTANGSIPAPPNSRP